jgi:tRNA G10  N-methylase Trm11
MIIKSGGISYLAESLGAQNITAYAKRDQERPARDAFVGMLPPKLAQIMLNLALGQTAEAKNVLDPFCGTGVVLQEALLQGHTVYGSDLSPKMVDYTRRNLTWLNETHAQYPLGRIQEIREGDAMDYLWAEAPMLDAVVCEAYLGQPFSATPSPSKLREVRGNCNHIIGAFLANISRQIRPGTRLCVAVPAWRNIKDNTITRLPLATGIREKEDFGLINTRPLLYFREDQIVARDILILEKL